MDKKILSTIGYFSQFSYPPTTLEVFEFLPVKTTRTAFETALKKLAKKGSVVIEGDRIARKKDRNFFALHSKRLNISSKKIKKVEPLVRLIAKLPQVKLVGLTGSVAMSSAQKSDDIDLFVITTRNRMFSARAFVLFFASILWVRRKRGAKMTKDFACFNLFFDEKNLSVPAFKKNAYIAHEILQMKPIVNKNQTYERFLKSNEWIYRIYPNAGNSEFKIQSSEWAAKILNSKSIHNSKFIILNSVGNLIEKTLKTFQLYLINKHRTNEYITGTQLWFFPEDFEKKVKL